MRIIMIDDNGRQSDITNEVQNILRGTRQNGVASDREQMSRAGFAPQQDLPAYGSQRPQRPQQTPFPQGRFMPQGGFTPHGMREEMPQCDFIPQGEMIPVPVDEFGNPISEIPADEEFGGFIPAPTPMEFNGNAQRPVMQRPMMGRPMMGMPQQNERQSFDEQAHRFAQRMTNGNGRQFVPAQGGMRHATSPNYRRNY